MDVDPTGCKVGARAVRERSPRHWVPALKLRQPRIDGPRCDGADFVINMVQVGGFDSTLVDFEIPRKYGLNFTIADTTGPGRLVPRLRTFPMLSGLCRDMEEICPSAILLNYSNPMSMNMQTISRTERRAGGGALS